jgi:starch synthase (maltosyl-transferring)
MRLRRGAQYLPAPDSWRGNSLRVKAGSRGFGLGKKAMNAPQAGRRRAVIEAVAPAVDGGRFPIKRSVGERVVVEATVFADGHDVLGCVVQHRAEHRSEWSEARMQPLGNDRWRGEFALELCGLHRYRVQAWVDHFATWRRDLLKRCEAGQDLSVPLTIGTRLVEQAAGRAHDEAALRLADWAVRLGGNASVEDRTGWALDEQLLDLMTHYPERSLATTSEPQLGVMVDRPLARFSAWYEVFPRSASPHPGRHGTLRDCEARLAYVAEMGFDIVYLPPIHPIGSTFRKGPNNTLSGAAGDPGSPWAIGSAAGGHTAVHPELGGLDDFRRLVAKAAELDLEIALDIAFQCSPDHPWVREHPQWFVHRPDGTIQYAENPPKKYQDIYPLNFETEDWRALWEALREVFLYWVEQGVTVFRVDNPHTKSLHFWEWVIAEVKRTAPGAIFLSEAFTRPPILHRLAKAGFSQSYNYFPWRNTKWELTQYFTELTRGPGREYLRPNLWPNTPDILPEYLQYGGRAAFAVRLVLAGTLGASYGIYGPAFELHENRALEPGSEEYLDSEKYQIKAWDLDRPDSLKDLIARVNRIRRDNPALHSDWNLRFHPIDNDQLIAYSKHDAQSGNTVLVVVNLDPHHRQIGWVELPLSELGMHPHQTYQMHDLLGGARYLWSGERNYVELDPAKVPGHIFRLRRRLRTERDFDYFF